MENSEEIKDKETVGRSELLSDENTPKYGTKEWLIMVQEIFKKA